MSSGKAYHRTFSHDEVQPLVEGNAEGILYGGCLSLLCASLGTPYEIHTDGSILFLEDRGEKAVPDRSHADAVEARRKVRGSDRELFSARCSTAASGTLPTGHLHDLVVRILGELGIPIAFGLKSGHVSSQSFTLPFGVRATLNVGQNVVLNFDAAVQPEPASVRVSRS